MKYFKFWAQESCKININGTEELINILSGSNISKDDARREAVKKSLIIEQRISKKGRKESYEVPIKEHLDKIIDDNNIITICHCCLIVLSTMKVVEK